MKLLTPFQQKDRQAEELARKVMRAQEVEAMAKKANINLAMAEADFNATLARNRAKWALEEEEHEQTVKGMTQEVEALEERKKQALIPIQLYKEEADKIMLETRGILNDSKAKDEQSEFLQEKLEDKLTDVGDRELAVAESEVRLELKKQGIETQQQQTKDGIANLSKSMLDFHLFKENEENSLQQRKEEVALAEINFNAKTEKYKRDLEALRVLQIQLRDERETLDREYKRQGK